MTFRVLVDDNFHTMDEDERYELGAFDTLEAAIAAARAMVDEFLVDARQPGQTAAESLRLKSGLTGRRPVRRKFIRRL